MVVCSVCSTSPARDESWTPYSSSSSEPPYRCHCRHLTLNLGDDIYLLSFSDGMRTLTSNPGGRISYYNIEWRLVSSSDDGFLDEILDDMVRCCVAQEVLWS